MKVKILKGTVLHSGKSYKPGEVIKQINVDDASRLIEKHVAKAYSPENEKGDHKDSEGEQTTEEDSPSKKDDSEEDEQLD